MQDKGSNDWNGRNGGSGKSIRAKGTGQSRVNEMHDCSSMSGKLSGKIKDHPMKDGANRKL